MGNLLHYRSGERRLEKGLHAYRPGTGRKGQFTQDFDANAYLAKVAVRCTVFPNLNDAELQQSYGVMGAEQLITTMLTPAEFEDYSTKVLQVNGFQSSDEMVEEAKN